MKSTVVLLLLALGIACGTSRDEEPGHAAPAQPVQNETVSSGETEYHVARGQYLFHSTEDSTTTVTINHEEIPGFMDAMAMPYAIRDLGLVEGLEPGQDIEFRVVVEDGGFYFVDRIVPFPENDVAAKD